MFKKLSARAWTWIFLVLSVAITYALYFSIAAPDCGMLRFSDDEMAIRAIQGGLSWKGLFVAQNDHMFPAGKFIYWIYYSLFGLNWAPYAHTILLAHALTLWLCALVILYIGESAVAALLIWIPLACNSLFLWGPTETFCHVPIYGIMSGALGTALVIHFFYNRKKGSLSNKGYAFVTGIALCTLFLLAPGPIVPIFAQFMLMAFHTVYRPDYLEPRNWWRWIDVRMTAINAVLAGIYLGVYELGFRLLGNPRLGSSHLDMPSTLAGPLRWFNFFRASWMAYWFPVDATDRGFGAWVWIRFPDFWETYPAEWLFSLSLFGLFGAWYLCWLKTRSTAPIKRVPLITAIFTFAFLILYSVMAIRTREYLAIVKFRYVIYFLIPYAVMLGLTLAAVFRAGYDGTILFGILSLVLSFHFLIYSRWHRADILAYRQETLESVCRQEVHRSQAPTLCKDFPHSPE